MDPEKENGQESTSGSENAVVVDLTESDEKKQIKPLTAEQAGEQSGDHVDDDATRTPANGEDEFVTTGRKDFDKRLKREIRGKLQERADKAVLADENERLRQENEQLRTRAPAREEAPNTADLDTKISAAKTKLAKALEDGESTTAADLQVEIGELTGQKATRLAAPRRETAPTERREQQRPAPKSGPTPTGKAFLEANESWWSDPENTVAKAAVIALDNQLIREGSDPNSESHYKRIAKRAKEQGLKVKIRQPFEDDDMGTDTTVDLDEPRRGERRPAPPQGGNGQVRQRGNSEVRDARAGKVVLKLGANLDGPDAVTMRTFKLDPANPQHVRAFAKSRSERILQENQA